ncbi:MAG TPA: hypothetical protein VD866_30870 [Urbifossiella sp.]|nr:hypothetical protein [Urbifossiella sp.]
MSVDVATGRALYEITNTNLTPSDTYKIRHTNDAIKNVPIATADATHPRIDIIVMTTDVSQDPDASAANIASITVVAGTPAASPAVPSTPANSLLLSKVAVAAGATSIVNANITDMRAYAMLASSVLADVLRQGLLGNTCALAGTDTYTGAYTPAVTSYTDKRVFFVVPANSNTGAVTVDLGGGAKSVVKYGATALASGDMKAKLMAILQYNATDDNFKLLSLPGNTPTISPSTVLLPQFGKLPPMFPASALTTITTTATIAYDATATATATATSLTYSHTCTGSNRVLLVGVFITSSSDLVTGVTYNGVAMTRIGTVTQGSERSYLYGLVNPASGANNVVVTCSGSTSIFADSASYTGSNQLYLPDATNTGNSGSATSLAIATTTVNDNCWTVMFGRTSSSWSAGAGTTIRGTPDTHNICDSNAAKTPAGSVTLTLSCGSAAVHGVSASIAPEPTAPDLQVFDFDQSQIETAEWVGVLPAHYTGGTFTAKFHWIAASGAGAARWAIQARAYADGDTLAQAFGTAQAVTDTLLATSQVQISGATGAVTIAGTPAAGQFVVFRVYRVANDAADTLNADARLVAVEITI